MKKKLDSWELLRKQIFACRKCKGLNIPEETMAATGYGDHSANVMLVAQSLHAYNPEYASDLQIPFVGPYHDNPRDSGNVLIDAIQAAGFQFGQFFTTNTVHCHPPKNRPSLQDEMDNCFDFLLAEIALVQPRLIIALGRQAANRFGITYEQGRVRDLALRSWFGKVTWLYHPSYFLRSGASTKQWAKKLKKLLKEFM